MTFQPLIKANIGDLRASAPEGCRWLADGNRGDFATHRLVRELPDGSTIPVALPTRQAAIEFAIGCHLSRTTVAPVGARRVGPSVATLPQAAIV